MILMRTILLVLMVGYVSSSSLAAMLYSDFEQNHLDDSLQQLLTHYDNNPTVNFPGLFPDKKNFTQWLESINQKEAFEFLNDVAGLALITFALRNGLYLMQPEDFSQDLNEVSATRDLILYLVDFIKSYR